MKNRNDGLYLIDWKSKEKFQSYEKINDNNLKLN